eukprot:CAMPEP_0168271006 /NCGR_PEP_ID=MMETSP0141_2-20121125/15336_1 /TAXON_ID=44445 /ORGANISM="Pseudo-nitzschia australis, Strain 10249 10 AB" /LENGTH=46 /DNA_ID= /DNA_START= /DNA_END= /DNA_ORIENTATION=
MSDATSTPTMLEAISTKSDAPPTMSAEVCTMYLCIYLVFASIASIP